MIPSSEFGGGLNGKVLAPGIVVICPIDKNRDHYTKIDFWPQIFKILGEKSTFSPLAANWSLTIGGSVGGCGARAVSRKTPIYFIQY